jgi:hypothetical protein
MNYIIGENLGSESLYVEYKEYCLISSIKFLSNNLMKLLVYEPNNIISMYNYKEIMFLFNKMISHDIKHYIMYYIPKYIGNFSCSQINGCLYIGIDDNGYIQGIPFYGNLSIKFIKRYIIKSLKYVRGFDFNNDEYNTYNYYIHHLTFSIIKLDSSNIKNDSNSSNKLKTLKDEYMSLVLLHEEYKKQYDQWIHKIEKYSIKLNSLMNDPEIKQEIIDFIKSHPDYDSNDDMKKAVITFQTTKTFTDIIDVKLIENVSNDLSNPIKWTVDFKDKKLHVIKQLKPKIFPRKIYEFTYDKYINNIKYIREQLHILGFDFYLIKINIPYIPNINCEYKIYKNSSDVWLRKKRFITNTGPYSDFI